VNEPLDPRLEDRLRAHFADRAANEPLPGAPGAIPSREPRSWWQRPPLLAVAAAVLVVVAVTAGLVAAGDDDSEDLDVVGAGSTTTDTTAPSSTTTGPPATTTTTTSPPNPAQDVRSVIVSIDGVLGWWDGTRYVRWDEGPLVPAEGGETYSIVGLGGPSTAVGSPPGPGCGLGDPEPFSIDVGLEYPEDHVTPPPIAVSGVADPAPRPLVALGSQTAYVEAAAEALAGLGVDDPAPALVQVLRTDFEGDGVDEVLLVAERLSDPATLFAQPGDYSVLLLRQVIDGQVRTTIVASSVADPEPGESPFVFVTRVAAAADLNGDGVMELATRAVYYEGAATAALRVDSAGGVDELLTVGCGA
jgi:hypothetical protein